MLTLINVMFLMFAPQAMVLHRAPLDYPNAAIRKGVQGGVLVEVNVDENGEVADARVISGPQELRNAALRSVLDWHFSKQTGLPAVTQVTVDFQLPATAAKAGRAVLGMSKTENGLVSRITIDGLNGPAHDTLLGRLPVREGDTLNAELFERVANEVQSFDEHLRVTLIRQAQGVTIDIGPRGVARNLSLSPTPFAARQPIKVGGSVQQMKLKEQARPVYPPEAKAAGIQGRVLLSAIIGADGRMKNLQVLSGEPALVPAATEAVRQWVYEPTRLNGELVEVATEIAVNFTLAK